MDTTLKVIQTIAQVPWWQLIPLLLYAVFGIALLIDDTSLVDKISGVVGLLAALTIVVGTLYAEDRLGWLGIDGGPGLLASLPMAMTILFIALVLIVLTLRRVGVNGALFYLGLSLMPCSYALFHASTTVPRWAVVVGLVLLFGGLVVAYIGLARLQPEVATNET